MWGAEGVIGDGEYLNHFVGQSGIDDLVDPDAGPGRVYIGRVKRRREHGDSGEADQVSGGRSSSGRRLKDRCPEYNVILSYPNLSTRFNFLAVFALLCVFCPLTGNCIACLFPT